MAKTSRILIDDYGKSIPKPPVTSSMDDASTWKTKKKPDTVTMTKDELEATVRVMVQKALDDKSGKSNSIDVDLWEDNLVSDEYDLDKERQLDDATEIMKNNRREASKKYDERCKNWADKHTDTVKSLTPKHKNQIERDEKREEILQEKKKQKKVLDAKREEEKIMELQVKEELHEMKRQKQLEKINARKEREAQELLKREEELKVAEEQKQKEYNESVATTKKYDDMIKNQKRQAQQKLEKQDEEIVQKQMNNINKKLIKRNFFKGTKVDKVMKSKKLLFVIFGIIIVAFILYAVFSN